MVISTGHAWNETDTGNSYNINAASSYKALLVSKIVAVCIIAIIGILTNITCLIVLRHMREMNPVTRVFMSSMTVADLGTCLFVCLPVFASAIVDSWPFGDIICTICSMLNVNCFFTSFMCLLNVNLERFLAVTYPFAYPNLVTVERARVTVAVLWLCAIAFFVMCSYLPGRIVYFSNAMHTCLTGPFDHEEIDIFGTVAFLMFVIIPFVTTLSLFLRLYLLAHHHGKQIAALQNVQNTESRKVRADRKIFMTFFIMTMVLSVGYTPLVASTVYENLARKSLPYYIVYIAEIMAFSNSFTNGIIYYLRNSKFRREARRVLGATIPLFAAGTTTDSVSESLDSTSRTLGHR